MSQLPPTIILGSRSPRRRELLSRLVPADAIRVLPPRSPDECGFDGLNDWPAIQRRLIDIARTKSADVLSQLAGEERGQPAAIVAADTIIVAGDEPDDLHVLGQPPEDDRWRDVVRGWFVDHYFGRTHRALTGLRVVRPNGTAAEWTVTTKVTFVPDDSRSRRLLEWYLQTGEPRGKAGGYALQGAGDLFVAAVEGSISNVVGLPLRELADAFLELEIDVTAIYH